MSDKPELMEMFGPMTAEEVIQKYPDRVLAHLKEQSEEIDRLRVDLAKPSEWISPELKRLLLAVNYVTAQHRHHNLPTKKALDNLANRQLEYEESLNQLPPPPTRETP